MTTCFTVVYDERTHGRSSSTLAYFVMLIGTLLCLEVVNRQHLLYAKNVFYATQLYTSLTPRYVILCTIICVSIVEYNSMHRVLFLSCFVGEDAATYGYFYSPDPY
jgi:hypothetical protein